MLFSFSCSVLKTMIGLLPTIITDDAMHFTAGYIGEFEFVDDHRSGKIVVELNGRLNKCGVISPRFDVGVKEIESWTARLLPSRQVSSWKVTNSLCANITKLCSLILQTMFSKNFILCLAVRLHRSHHLCWHHGPRRGKEKEYGWEGPWLLLLAKSCSHRLSEYLLS